MRSPVIVHRALRWLAGPRGVCVAFVLLHAAWLATHAGGERWRVIIGDGFFVPTFVAIAVFAWRASRAYRESGRRSGSAEMGQFAGAWALLAVAYSILWVSNLVWFWTDLARAAGAPSIEPRYASLLDLFAYLLLVMGLLRFPVMRSDLAMRRRIRLDLLTVGVGATLVTWYLLIRPLGGRTPGTGLADLGAFSTAVGDVAVLVAVAAMMIRHGFSRERRWLLWLAAGHAASCVASLVGGTLQIQSAYLPGAPIDALWMLSDLLILLAADEAAQQAGATTSSPAPAPSRGPLWYLDERTTSAPIIGMQLWLPHLFVAIAFGVLVVETSSQWNSTLGIVVAANAIVLVLVALASGWPSATISGWRDHTSRRSAGSGRSSSSPPISSPSSTGTA
jgi:hypothetical protein